MVEDDFSAEIRMRLCMASAEPPENGLDNGVHRIPLLLTGRELG